MRCQAMNRTGLTLSLVGLYGECRVCVIKYCEYSLKYCCSAVPVCIPVGSRQRSTDGAVMCLYIFRSRQITVCCVYVQTALMRSANVLVAWYGRSGEVR